MNDALKPWGPLAYLAGVWEGDKGDDVAVDDDRGVENNKYRERITFEPLGPTMNHEQALHGLRYSTVAHRIGEKDPFHEELGYWLWDSAHKQVCRCFMIPRGVTVIAGGSAEATSKVLKMAAEVGSHTYGICSNSFLDREFKTMKYVLTVTIHDENSFTYDEDTMIQIKGQKELFHHTDKNTLKRVK